MNITIKIFLNYIMAWISMVCVVITALKFISKRVKKRGVFLDKIHIPAGMALIASGAVHGLFSSQKLWSLNSGAIALAIALLLPVTYIMKRFFGKKKEWLLAHRVLTVYLIAACIWHIADVGGINVINVISMNLPVRVKAVNQSNQTRFDSDVLLKDGTYTGAADGFGPDLTVKVVVSKGSVTDITIVSHNEKREEFYGAAFEQIPRSIMESQSLQVDAVTGATATSQAIIDAVRTALESAE